MAYLRQSILNRIDIKDFIIYFCVAYTVFDIAGAVVAEFNHFGGGIINDKNVPALVEPATNNTVNLIITVKPDL
jgi:hypothetical protein